MFEPDDDPELSERPEDFESEEFFENATSEDLDQVADRIAEFMRQQGGDNGGSGVVPQGDGN